jgi:C4-dicarboxylate transporter DctM subunit
MDFQTVILILSIILLLFLLAVGAPFYVAFLLPSVVILFALTSMGGMTLANMGSSQIRSFTLIAIPLFLLLGNIMAVCGATRVLFNFARVFIGWIPGGLGMAAVIACAMFGTMCGSVVATAMAVGSIAVPELTKAGYSREQAAAICACGGTLGPLIPPSIAFIIIGPILKVSVGDLFLAGIVPGIICMLFLCIAIYFMVRGKIAVDRHYSWRERGRATLELLPIAVLPAAIIGTLWGGIATPTEAAGVAIVFAVFLARFYFRKFGWKEVKAVLKDSMRTSAAIYCIMIAAVVFGQALGTKGIPQAAGAAAGEWGLGYGAFMLVFVGVFIVLGCFFDSFILVLVCLPPLLPAVLNYPELATNLVPFGVIFLLLTNIGMITPPVGIGLYATAAAADADTMGTIRQIPLLLIAMTVTTLLLVFVPGLCIY